MPLNFLKHFKKNKKVSEDTLSNEQEIIQDEVEQILPIEEVTVTERKVSCDGSKISWHPLVYYTIKEDTDRVVCWYCSKTFVFKK